MFSKTLKSTALVVALLAMLSVIFNSSAIYAQDSENYTCDGGENDIVLAIEAALDAGQLDTAEALIAEAQVLCGANVQAFQRVLALNNDLTQARRNQDENELIANADPGFVDLGEYSLFMDCQGEGEITLVMENGSEEDIDTWDDVMPGLTALTRVCRYNRLGMYRSDDVPGGETRTVYDQAQDLHDLLEAANIAPPYVLVGHSIAGYMLLAFPDLFPDDVAGLVFVDANHPEDQWERFSGYDGVYVASEDSLAGTDMMLMSASEAEIEARNAGDLGDLPIAVLAATRRFGGEVGEVWLELQQAHAARSTNSLYVEVISGHNIQNTRPEAVIEAVEWVLAEINESTATEPTLTQITPDDYVNRISSQPHQLIDVRTPEEFNSGYIEGASNIPLAQLPNRLDELDPAVPVVVYCRSGNRSATAAQILRDAGFSVIYDLGGTLQWTEAGYRLTQ